MEEGKKIEIDDENGESEFSVRDKRFSARKEEEELEKPEEQEPEVSVEDLKTELESKDKMLKEYTASLKKMQEENRSFRNRLERDLEKRVEREKSGFILKLLEIIDNMERAVESAEQTDDTDSLIDGIRMIHMQFKNFLESEEVEIVETIGKEFDPNIQEAVEVVPVSVKKDDNIVMDEIQKGYTMNDQLVRPAKVRVGKFSKKTPKNDS